MKEENIEKLAGEGKRETVAALIACLLAILSFWMLISALII